MVSLLLFVSLGLVAPARVAGLSLHSPVDGAAFGPDDDVVIRFTAKKGDRVLCLLDGVDIHDEIEATDDVEFSIQPSSGRHLLSVTHTAADGGGESEIEVAFTKAAALPRVRILSPVHGACVAPDADVTLSLDRVEPSLLAKGVELAFSIHRYFSPPFRVATNHITAALLEASGGLGHLLVATELNMTLPLAAGSPNQVNVSMVDGSGAEVDSTASAPVTDNIEDGVKMSRDGQWLLYHSLTFVVEEGGGCADDVTKVLRMMMVARARTSPYSAAHFEAGYHTMFLKGKEYVGQRRPVQRLAKVRGLYDFRNKSVLDLGCNQGGMLFDLADEISYGVGVDFDPLLINACNARKAHFGPAHLHFYSVDLNQAAHVIRYLLPAVKVDVVFMLMVWPLDSFGRMLDFAASVGHALLLERVSPLSPEHIARLKQHYQHHHYEVSTASDDDRGGNRRRKMHFFHN